MALAILIMPIAFCANVVRVMILVLVTYHFGDEAGQGFVHGFAGMVLFMVALALILAHRASWACSCRERARWSLGSRMRAAFALAMWAWRSAMARRGLRHTPGLHGGPAQTREAGGDRALAFGDWEVDRSVIPGAAQPRPAAGSGRHLRRDAGADLPQPRGQRVMLSLAYGRNQHKGMNTHRPEVCYPAQGFRLVRIGARAYSLRGQATSPVTRVVAAEGARNEPITYWLLVGESITSSAANNASRHPIWPATRDPGRGTRARVLDRR